MGLFDFLKGAAAQNAAAEDAAVASAFVVSSPVAGTVVRQARIPDPVFATGMMGVSVGVAPEDSTVVAPVSGTVLAAMPHAYGITCDNGAEVIVHVGVDTVEMSGAGFEMKVVAGQKVKTGDPLVKFDRKMVAEAGFSDVIIVAVSNSDALAAEKNLQLADIAPDKVACGTALIGTLDMC